MKLRRIVDMEFFDGIAADHADHAIRRRCRERRTRTDWLEILV